jgi:hypothetical protein
MDYPALAIQNPNIVGGFIGGMGQAQELTNSRTRNAMLEQQQQMQAQAMQRDEQFRNLLAQSVGPMAAGAAAPPGAAPAGAVPGAPGAEPGAASYLAQNMQNPLADPSVFNQMLAIDPERAVEFQQVFQQQQQQREAALRERAGVAVRAAQFVLKSKDPKRTLELGFPEMVEQLKAQGVELEDLDDDLVRGMANDVVAQFGPIAGVGPAGAGDPFTLSQGQVRFDAEGNEIASVAAAETDKDPNDKNFQRATSLRKEYDNARGSFDTIRSAWENVQAAERGDAGDTQLVLNYMRLISPGVRIQPGQAIDDAASVPGVSAGVIGMWNKLVGDGKLNDSQRNELRSQARTTYARQERLAREARERYTELATDAGVDPKLVVGEDRRSVEKDAQGRAVFSSEADAEAAGLKPGTKVVIGGVPGTWQ